MKVTSFGTANYYGYSKVSQKMGTVKITSKSSELSDELATLSVGFIGPKFDFLKETTLFIAGQKIYCL